MASFLEKLLYFLPCLLFWNKLREKPSHGIFFFFNKEDLSEATRLNKTNSLFVKVFCFQALLKKKENIFIIYLIF